MNKQELINKIARETELSKKDVATVLDAFQSTAKETVISGEKLALSGFITFDKKHVPARSGVSAITGDKWKTPEKDEIKVSLSKRFKEI